MPKHTRLKLELEKLKEPNVLETFQTMIGGKFAPLTIMNNEDTFNTAVTKKASEIFGKTSSEEKNLVSLQKLLSVRQKEKIKKETI